MKWICVFIFLLFSGFSHAQKRTNRLSLELGYGFNIPLTPKNDIVISDYIIPRHIDLGMRYMFDAHFGMKIHYANDRFQNKSNGNSGVGYHRLGLEGVYNLNRSLNIFGNNFSLLFHTGIGITYAFPEAIKRFKNGGEFTFGLKPYNTKRYERIGNLIFGLTPQFRLSDRMAFTFDTVYVINTEQQYSYSGELLYINRQKVRGSFINISFGIQFYLGKERRHIDWYNRGRKY